MVRFVSVAIGFANCNRHFDNIDIADGRLIASVMFSGPMTLISRKKTIRNALRDVAMAPFVFIFVMAWANRIWIVLAILLMLFCMWMAHDPLAGLVPSLENLYIWLLVIAFIAIAALPLAIRDYFSNGGYETVWRPTDGYQAAAIKHVGALLAGDSHRLISSLSPRFKTRTNLDYFAVEITSFSKDMGPSVSVTSVDEKEIPRQVFEDPGYNSEIDCVVQIILSDLNRQNFRVVLFLNSRHSFQIAGFQFEAFGT